MGRKVKRWQKWHLFIEELPVIFNIGKSPYDVWYKRHSGPHKCKPRSKYSFMNIAFINPERERLGLPKSKGFHQAAIATEAIEQSHYHVLAFMTTKPNNDELPVKIKKIDKKSSSYLHCFCLWELEAIPGESLIELLGDLDNDKGQYSEIIGKIRKLLCLDNCENYKHSEQCEFTYGEVIKVNNPSANEEMEEKKESDKETEEDKEIEGVVLAGIKDDVYHKRPQVLFLPLVKHEPFHDDENELRFIPVDLADAKLSVAVTKLRFAPMKSVARWRNERTIISDYNKDIMADIRAILGEYFGQD